MFVSINIWFSSNKLLDMNNVSMQTLHIYTRVRMAEICNVSTVASCFIIFCAHTRKILVVHGRLNICAENYNNWVWRIFFKLSCHEPRLDVSFYVCSKYVKGLFFLAYQIKNPWYAHGIEILILPRMLSYPGVVQEGVAQVKLMRKSLPFLETSKFQHIVVSFKSVSFSLNCPETSDCQSGRLKSFS